MQIIGANTGPKTPGLTMLKPGTGVASPVDKPTGYGSSGYALPKTYVAPVQTSPNPYGNTGSASAALQGYTTSGPAQTGQAGSLNVPSVEKQPGGSSGGTNAGGGPSGDMSGSQSIYNLDTDPIVAKIKALNANNYANAVSAAQASAKQDLIGSGFSFGDLLTQNPQLAAGILGSVLADQATQQAAQQNPYSTARQLFTAHDQNVNSIDQADNAANLYYSSTRGNQQGAEAKGYLGNVASAQGTLQGALSTLLGNVAAEKATEDQNLANAYDQARENAVMNAINSGEILLGYDENGNPIFGAAPSADTGVSDSTAAEATAPQTAATAAAPAKAATPTTLAKLVATARPGGVSRNKKQGIYAIH